MKNIINGGLYNVNLNSDSPSGFTGDHPTLILRTLKEQDVYIVIPFTSYTKERWNKCRRAGFGIRVHSSNSIARIDKFSVITRDKIKNRWIKDSKILKIETDEFESLNQRFNEYITLSTEKAEREYKKYYEQYEFIYGELIKIKNNSNDSVLNSSIENSIFEIKIKPIMVNNLTKLDIKNIASNIFNAKDVSVIKKDDIIIKINLE